MSIDFARSNLPRVDSLESRGSLVSVSAEGGLLEREEAVGRERGLVPVGEEEGEGSGEGLGDREAVKTDFSANVRRKI